MPRAKNAVVEFVLRWQASGSEHTERLYADPLYAIWGHRA